MDRAPGAKVLPLRRLEGRTEDLSDDALLAACALGDRAALGALFDRHYERVRRFLFHYGVTDEAEVDDLIQSTFEILQRSAHRFQGRSEVATWMLGIARNVARRELRSRARRSKLAVALVAEPDPPDRALDDALLEKQRAERLRAAVWSLSDKLREVFVLVYMEGVPGTEAAKVLGVREGTLYKRLHVARKKLIESLGGEL